MLKHASNASSATAAVPVSGQLLRTANNNNGNSNGNVNGSGNSNANNSNCNGNNTSTNNPPSAAVAASAATTTMATSPVPNVTAAAAAAAAAAATAGASPTPVAAAVASTARNIHLRPPQPLNISALNASNSMLNGCVRSVANASTLLNISTQAAPMKPLTPLTPNGNCNGNSLHHHTYTNQHMLASSSSSTHQQQQQQQHQPQSMHLPHHTLNSNNNNINNNNNNMHNYSHCNNLGINPNSVLQTTVKPTKHGPGPREVLTSLGLLCLVSLLLALLSLIFLLKISPNTREDAVTRSINSDDFIIVYDVTLALCALSLSLNLCCLLVCAIQFLFAVKLLRSPMFDGRDNKYLEKSSASRTCAVSGFFISIPVFLTGIILYTFNHFHSTPAIITSILIGIGIVFCGGAMVHNVFVWQKEKTISYRTPPLNMSLHLPSAQLFNSSGCPAVLPHYGQQNQSMLHHPTSVTPVSPNHSHGSFNPLLSTNNNNNNNTGGIINSPFLVRPATATPPTPKPISIAANGSCLMGREASGSVSPGIPPTLDMSNITISLHELSTLV